MDKIPLNINGKVDREQLPLPNYTAVDISKYEVPRNEIETTISSVWSKVLGTNSISINDNFFELGGDSIKAIQISSMLNDYGLKIEIKDLFEHPQIKELALYIKNTTCNVNQDIVEGIVKLTPIQKWFFSQRFTNQHYFNQSVMLFSNQNIDKTDITKVLDRLVEHHDALRMAFKVTDNGIEQFNRGLSENLYEIKVIDIIDEGKIENIINQESIKIQGSIDLENGPLLKCGLFKTPNASYLLIVIHHLVVDGISWRVILEDFNTLYLQITNNEPIHLPKKTFSFRDWAEKIYDYAHSEELLNELSFWDNQFTNSYQRLPKDNVSTTNKMKDSSNEIVSLSINETRLLLNNVNTPYGTDINDILLTALCIAIKEWAGINTISINLESHGRNKVIDGIDISRTVGWFTFMYPVLFDLSKSNDVLQQIKIVKETLRHIPGKGIGYLIYRYLLESHEKSLTNTAGLPEISFNYLGQVNEEYGNKFFKFSYLSRGMDISPDIERKYTFYIDGMIDKGSLVLYFNYNKNEYQKETVYMLISLFKKNLLKIINLCVNENKTIIFPNDVYNKTISTQDYKKIIDLVKDIDE